MSVTETSQDRLRELADKATEYRTGPTRFKNDAEGVAALERRVRVLHKADARVKALAPELARWAADAAEELAKHGSEYRDTHGEYISERKADALLARLAGITGPSQGDGHGSHREAGEGDKA